MLGWVGLGWTTGTGSSTRIIYSGNKVEISQMRDKKQQGKIFLLSLSSGKCWVSQYWSQVIRGEEIWFFVTCRRILHSCSWIYHHCHIINGNSCWQVYVCITRSILWLSFIRPTSSQPQVITCQNRLRPGTQSKVFLSNLKSV